MLQRPLLLIVTVASLVLSHSVSGQDDAAQPDSPAGGTGQPAALSPTTHPALPENLSDYWFVPEPLARSRAEEAIVQRLVRGVALVSAGNYAAGLPDLKAAAAARAPIADHVQYHTAVALIGLARHSEADTILTTLSMRAPDGYLAEAIPQRIADVALALGDPKRAVEVLEDLSGEKLLAPEQVFLRLGEAAERAGEIEKALKAYRRVYYELPMSAEAVGAQAGIERLETADRIAPDRFALELERADTLFNARRWAQARAAFEPLARVARGDEAEVVALRLAECEYYLDRFRSARDRLVPYLGKAKREAEARFFHLTATRALGDRATYLRLARQLIADHPDSSWSEETLHNLATHYITADDDAEADSVFRELVRRFPRSRHSERAAWKVGWRAYRAGSFREAAEMFEWAAAAFPRADYRPAWLYWSARSRVQVDQPELAAERYAITIADYGNSYYGRLATRALASRPDVRRVAAVTVRRRPVTPIPVQTDARISALISHRLYDDALREVQYAQRVWGDSARLQATGAFIRHNQGLGLKAEERFTALRGAINTMRRAYPQFMAVGGEQLPPDVLRIIFPLDYWPLITKYSKAHSLDPYLMAALMAQESTFTPEIKSSANAIGLMQLIPGTGRRYARQLGIRNFSTRSLTQPETNVRLGMKYFKELIDRFGGAHYALASYNAGENRVSAWIKERPPLPADEFIDDIPFPETQNYVKRILGTAEDYRFLYGGGLLDPDEPLTVASAGGSPRDTAPAAQRRSTATAPASRRVSVPRSSASRR